MVPVMSPHQLMKTEIARDFPHNMEVARDVSLNVRVRLMVHMMSLHQWMQAMIAREPYLNMEASLMIHMMSIYQLMQTKVARDFFHNMGITRY